MSDIERKMGENNLERQSEHLEDSDFNPKRQREGVLDVVVNKEGEVPQKKQVQMHVEENRANNTYARGQAKNEVGFETKAKAPAPSHSYSYNKQHDYRRYQSTDPLKKR
ncbi:hypothetical protein Fot_35494 [Forsythia ovata]|uniref:Uncharacterized protein n=1 Tax=Forsythia ovata TaxID=205694 RepID=A0ABD1SMC7_9LAMI